MTLKIGVIKRKNVLIYTEVLSRRLRKLYETAEQQYGVISKLRARNSLLLVRNVQRNIIGTTVTTTSKCHVFFHVCPSFFENTRVAIKLANQPARDAPHFSEGGVNGILKTTAEAIS